MAFFARYLLEREQRKERHERMNLSGAAPPSFLKPVTHGQIQFANVFHEQAEVDVFVAYLLDKLKWVRQSDPTMLVQLTHQQVALSNQSGNRTTVSLCCCVLFVTRMVDGHGCGLN
jgi:hypothetical protein